MVTSFNADKIVELMRRKKDGYRIPFHEFSKAALLGDYSHYHAKPSLAMIIFDVKRPDPREHFLVPLLLSYLNLDGNYRDCDGFVSVETITYEMQS